MKIRPTSVTVISWILIAMGGISLITTTMMLIIPNPRVQELMAQSPIPVPIQYVISYAGLAVMIISGLWMLKGQNWARLLYVIWSALGLVIGLATSPMKAMLIPGVLIYGVVVFFLFRPKANQFFSKPEAASATESN
jgi:hypothetical protein